MLREARAMPSARGGNLFADILAGEVADGSRDRSRGPSCSPPFVPFAARWPVEVHIYPNRFVQQSR